MALENNKAATQCFYDTAHEGSKADKQKHPKHPTK
jgi:hypothetical protein